MKIKKFKSKCKTCALFRIAIYNSKVNGKFEEITKCMVFGNISYNYVKKCTAYINKTTWPTSVKRKK
jgi:hypothetical protein